jgi:hypothetical protein
MATARKVFFLEKKEAKNFCPLASAANFDWDHECQGAKVFWLFFQERTRPRPGPHSPGQAKLTSSA